MGKNNDNELVSKDIEVEYEETASVIDGSGFGKSVIQKDIDTVLSESMIPYSEHVILDRALPRVEDGLKPVQRRILYTLFELDITPEKDYKKSARIVGECLGKFHPHGDTSVYDAMVRMAQDFNMREVLVDGHGNYGSVDGDGAAAMRYTEARMAPLAMEVLRDLDKNTVDWTLNFDDTLQEPVTLPCRFPNILVNGANGIAIGLATNIPTHNLGEVISGCIAMIDNRDITLDEMMKIIPGPDFPTGGYIIAGDELKTAYETGKAKIMIRAKAHIEGKPGEKQSIVITELPYQVNKSKMLQQILNVRDSKKYDLSCITDILDESDRQGTRAVVRLKKDTDIKSVLDILFKETDMQVSYGINMVAIADGRPQQMGLLDIIAYYIDYQRIVIYRRTKHDLDIAKEREHILLGLIIAVKNIDEVIKIIKKSEDTSDAKRKLIARFNLSDRQAQAILDMRLARLTSLEIYKLEQELKEVQDTISRLSEILGSKKLQFEIIKQEMLDVKRKFKDPRKSVIIKTENQYKVSDLDLIKTKGNQTVYVALTKNSMLKCLTPTNLTNSSKLWTQNSKLHEVHTNIIKTNTDKKVLVFTNYGNVYKIGVDLVPNCKWKEKGIELSRLADGIKKDEIAVGLIEEPDETNSGSLYFFTEQGIVKKSPLSEYIVAKSSFVALKLKEDDKLIGVEIEKPKTSIMFVTMQGLGLNSETIDIPEQGRIASGVKGILLGDGDKVVGVSQVETGENIVLVSDFSYAKQINTSEIEVSARYRKGVKVFDLKGEKSSGNKVLCAERFSDIDEVVVESLEGDYSSISIMSIAEDTRSSRGSSLSVEKHKQILSATVRRNSCLD